MEEIIRTVKFKIDMPLDIAKRTIQVWNDACNYISDIAFENPSIACNRFGMHNTVYYDVKSRFGLSAQVTQNAIHQVTAKYQAIKTAKHDLKKPVYFKSHNAIELQGGIRGRDFGFRRSGLSISTIDGRLKNIVAHGPPTLDKYLKDWKLGDAMMLVRKGRVFLYVAFKRNVEPVTKPNDAVVGVDRGICYIAVTTDGKRSQFFGGKRVRHIRNRYKKTHASLQQKKAIHNTRSIRRVLKRFSGKETRFMRDANHVVSRRIVDFAQKTGNPTISIERLGGIGNDIKNRMRKDQRQDATGWAFSQLEKLLRYKAADLGYEVIEVDPKGTSKGCSRCGYTSPGNRHQHSFSCKSCGYKLHADLNAARNIRLRGILIRQVLGEDGSPSIGPEARVSSDIAGKSSRLTPENY